jgi:hypothetical protein
VLVELGDMQVEGVVFSFRRKGHWGKTFVGFWCLECHLNWFPTYQSSILCNHRSVKRVYNHSILGVSKM